MSLPPTRPFAGFDPERHARRLAPAGGLLATLGCCFGGWIGIVTASVGVGLLLLSAYSRTDGLLILGPFARYELIRAVRTRRFWIIKTAIAATAGAVVLVNMAVFDGETVGETARANRAMLGWLVVALVWSTCMLTVILVPPAVAEERDGRRWDVLLTTDLRSREIVFGKLVGRLAIVFVIVLATVPILALTPLFGGIPPGFVGTLAIMLLATVLGLAGIAIFSSAVADKPGDAVGSTIGLGFLYLILSGILMAVQPVVGSFPKSIGIASPVTVADFIGLATAGNPVGLVMVMDGTGPGSDVDGILFAFAQRYAAFHVGVFLLFALMAAARLRAVGTARPAAEKVAPKPTRSAISESERRASLRPPVSDEPVYWWERYARMPSRDLRGPPSPRQLVKTTVLVWAAVMAAPYVGGWVKPGLFESISTMATFFLRLTVCIKTLTVACGPISQASNSLERKAAARLQADLRWTDLTAGEILDQKCRAAIDLARTHHGWLAAFAVAGLASGVCHPIALLVIAANVFLLPRPMAEIGLSSWIQVRRLKPRDALMHVVLWVFATANVTGIAGMVFIHWADRHWTIVAGVIAMNLGLIGTTVIFGKLAFRMAERQLERELTA